jgi:hypothetical protein
MSTQRGERQIDMVRHPSEGVHTNREAIGQQADAGFDQSAAVVVASVAEAILPEQPRASDAAGRDMHEHGVTGRDQGQCGGRDGSFTGAFGAISRQTEAIDDVRRIAHRVCRHLVRQGWLEGTLLLRHDTLPRLPMMEINGSTSALEVKQLRGAKLDTHWNPHKRFGRRPRARSESHLYTIPDDVLPSPFLALGVYGLFIDFPTTAKDVIDALATTSSPD